MIILSEHDYGIGEIDMIILSEHDYGIGEIDMIISVNIIL
jgi:hypothetical protein